MNITRRTGGLLPIKPLLGSNHRVDRVPPHARQSRAHRLDNHQLGEIAKPLKFRRGSSETQEIRRRSCVQHPDPSHRHAPGHPAPSIPSTAPLRIIRGSSQDELKTRSLPSLAVATTGSTHNAHSRRHLLSNFKACARHPHSRKRHSATFALKPPLTADICFVWLDSGGTQTAARIRRGWSIGDPIPPHGMHLAVLLTQFQHLPLQNHRGVVPGRAQSAQLAVAEQWQGVVLGRAQNAQLPSLAPQQQKAMQPQQANLRHRLSR